MNRRPFFLSSLVIGLGIILSLLVVVFKNHQFQDTSSTSDISQESLEQTSTLVRQAAVAGQFYPSDTQTLIKELEGYLQDEETTTQQNKPRILIVPHAGLIYSGHTAGRGFAKLAGHEYNKVFIISSNHRVVTSHASVYSTGAWQTPLGDVQVNEAYASILIDEKNNIIKDLEAFAGDHTIEMELLFLQRVLDDFTIIPILLGQVNESTIDALAQSIANIFDNQTLLVISTDLSHYPTWESANIVDEMTIQAVMSGYRNSFHNSVTIASNAEITNLDTRACGAKAIEVALGVAEFFEIDDFSIIDYSNSGDITGDHSRVVGYAAIVGRADQIPIATLDDETKQESLEIARVTLETYLLTNQIPTINPKSRYLSQPLGAFVTLEKNDQLRGCIGHFEPKEPLYKVIQSTAIDAALHDRRFKPVTNQELETLDIEISIMTPIRIIDNWEDIELGKHGVVIQKGSRSGTFLPQVAIDTGWSREEFYEELCSQKAGLPRNCYLDPDVMLYVFEADIFSEYDD